MSSLLDRTFVGAGGALHSPITVEVGDGERVSEVLPELLPRYVGDDAQRARVEDDAALEYVVARHAHSVVCKRQSALVNVEPDKRAFMWLRCQVCRSGIRLWGCKCGKTDLK